MLAQAEHHLRWRITDKFLSILPEPG